MQAHQDAIAPRNNLRYPYIDLVQTRKRLADLIPPVLSALSRVVDALATCGGPAFVTTSFRHSHSERRACVRTTHPSVENRGSVAVGTTVSHRPPHRSVRAALPHTAPTSDV